MQHPAQTVAFTTLQQNLQQELKNGNIYEIQQGNLSLYCYTNRCVYNRLWNDWNILARGLILDRSTQQIIATPFPKFFNYGEINLALPDHESFEIYEKFSISFFYTSLLIGVLRVCIQINVASTSVPELFPLP